MALSIAQAHQRRARAAMEAAKTAPQQSMAGATAYEHQLNQLLQDRLRLKAIQSNEGKAALKAQLLPEYIPYVEGVLAAGNGAQDDVMTTVMVWRVDVEDYSGALDIADYVLKHKLIMPDRFERTTGCLVAEEIATAALKAQKANGSFDLSVLHRTVELTDAEDMPDQARAKLYLATGRATLDGITAEEPGQPGQIQAGIDLLKRAIELHEGCGGKKDLDGAERLLKKHAATGS
ncbi:MULTISPECIES: phage terminase small subunit [unclassified Pseudomonas]|uniref:phage terminase small subunit n=1 Tax=unclassified Pseudomonas TaxID=196821 RepID=UPI000C86B32A|nr:MULTISPECIES: terminase endonuclease subunit [unclassified Pseudomonas]PMV21720.1 terminase [Pseudomonas sp. FW305-3-2-15-C-TSA2]PMV28392.1 terminase [Pseudomonas sp. DP16D-L5]PMV38789.1 terminase [Pseudomonas sp. FW305-3-2-15-A-LB2]PMV43927.1 terminase [Pseudomonas sp. FW305-3-2-15-C-R2A1]PMV51020.1 terminase [Pseudomonas sp. FW305-3-2-15-C-LB1]